MNCRSVIALFSLILSTGLVQAQTLPCYTSENYQQKGILFNTQATGNPASPTAFKGKIRIPVVVHVIHDGVPNIPLISGDPTTYEDNIPDSAIFHQMEVLNADFNRLNADAFATVPEFQAVAASFPFEFVLATKDPSGNPSTGIDRVIYPGFSHPGLYTNQEIETIIKPLTIWDANKYLNIWTIRFTESTGSFALLGYAQFPDSSKLAGMPADGEDGSANTDGIVINPIVFGTKGAADYFNSKSRTTVHELGHFFGLRHIWGDGDCTVDDYVDDTPDADAPSSGCNLAQQSCGGLNMVQNYMDYTNGACQNIFTKGQAARFATVMQNSPRRRELANSDAATVGIQPISGANYHFAIFPNPAKDQLALTLSGQPKTGTMICIYSLLGEKLLEQAAIEGYQQLPVSDLSAGSYLLTVGTKRQLFIKQ